MNAQVTTSSPAGEYYLHGVRETASGFKLNPDGTFGFFFSYGALDRYGQGTWSVHNDTLVMNSRPKPAQEFTLLSSAPAAGGPATVRIDVDNAYLRPYFFCKISGGGKTQEGTTDSKGMIRFAEQPVDSVELQFEFCPEKKSVFQVAPGHRTFVFAPGASLTEVFFRDFRLKLTAEGLEGGHPLSNEKTFRYEKNH